jgi:2-octaprenylphenol hydroxylase
MTSHQNLEFDIVIVGGGMVGATMASLLRGMSLRIALIDRIKFDEDQFSLQLETSKFDPRVSALTSATKRIFEELDLWKDIQAVRCCDYQNMHVWDADGTGSISFSSSALNQAELGTIVENSVLTAALYKKIVHQENLTVLAPFSIDKLEINDSGSTLTTECGTTVVTRLIIAADGANSKVRELGEFDTREWNYDHHAIVTTVKTEKKHQLTTLQRFIETGPLAFLPLSINANDSEQNHCSIVWSSIPDRTEELISLNDEAFCLELGRSIESRLGTIEWCDKRFAFPLRQRHAVDYVKHNVVLIGDAAHSIHPLAGQGVNLGFMDAATLANELLHGREIGRELNDLTVLNRYQRKRIGQNLGMMWMMEGFKHLFAEQALPVRWLRNIGMTGVDNLSVVKNHLARRAMGLDW